MSNSKRTLVMDIECYINYFLVQFKAVDTGAVRAFEMYPDEEGDYIGPGDHKDLERRTILSILKTYQVVTFNGMDYDMPLLMLALKGASCEELKKASDHIIVGQLRGWQFENTYGVRVPDWLDHIDLKEPVPGVQISLKLYGGRLHSKRLQDLPYPPEKVIDPSERAVLRQYCENDLDTTIDLWKKARDPKDDIIGTRELLTAESGVDVRSKSDAQIAEAIIKHRVEKLTGQRLYRAEVRPGTVFRYQPPAWLKFNHPALRAKLAEICASDFVINAKGKVDMPLALRADTKKSKKEGDDSDVVSAPASSRIALGHSVYTMGIGGLHSTEKSQAVIASDTLLLRDVDVVSYYPRLILQCGLFPENMGSHFQRIYQEFYDRRVAAKKSGQKSTAQTLKIFLNGTFGKLGSKWSVLYAPNLLIQVTVTGQLALLMLIERFEAAGIPVVSANTDGVVQACPAHLDEVRKEIVRQWERETGFETEETAYRALFSRDVNNYVALKAEGGVKTKGVFADPGVMKSPANVIVGEAVCEYLDKGTPFGETILKCRDVRKFLTVKRVSGGGTWRGEYQGKVVRWIRSSASVDPILYQSEKKLGDKVGGSTNARPVMELPDALPSDIDYDFYIGEARDALREIGALQ
jgi:hypothetical protein